MRGDGNAAGGRRPRLVTITVAIQRAWLAECFATLTASHLRTVDVEFVLVDNACTDGGRELVTRQRPTTTVLSTSRREGFASANNLAIRYALARGADYVFLVNPDTRTPPDLMERLVDFMEAWPEYGIVGPLQYRYTTNGSDDGQLNDWSLTALRAGESNIFDLDAPGLPSPAGPADGRAPGTLEHAYVQGAALMCRADVLRGVGLLDETYHSYYEESDLCRRARWGGWRVALLTDLGIQHVGGGVTGNSRYRRRHMLRNKYYFLVTDPEWRVREIIRRSLRWLIRDLSRRGTAPPERTWTAVGDTLVGVLWLLGRGSRITARRRVHRRLFNDGAGGPLAARPHRGAGGREDRDRTAVPRHLRRLRVGHSAVSARPLVIAVCCSRLEDLRKRWEHNIAQLDGEVFFVLLDCARSAEADELADQVRAAGGLVEFHGERRGLAAARNSVLAAWPECNVVFVDDDVELNRNALVAAGAAFRSGAEIVGARLVPPNRPVRWSWCFTPGQMHLVGWHPPGVSRTWGAFMGLDGRFARRHGLRFDARLGRTGQRLESGDDTSFVVAMRAAGAREIMLAAEAVVHDVDPERFTARYLVRRAYWQGRSEVRRSQPLAGLRKEWARQTAPGAGLAVAPLYIAAFIIGVIREILR